MSEKTNFDILFASLLNEVHAAHSSYIVARLKKDFSRSDFYLGRESAFSYVITLLERYSLASGVVDPLCDVASLVED